MTSPTPSRFHFLARFGLREWPSLIGIGVLMICGAGIAAVAPLPMKVLVDYGLRGAPLPAWTSRWGVPADPAGIVLLAALLSVAVFALQTAITTALTWWWSVLGQRMVNSLAITLFRTLLRLTPLYHSKSSVGDSISRLTGDTWCVYTFMSGFLMGPVHQLLLLFSVGAIAFSLDRQLAWISLGIAPLLAFSSRFFGERLKSRATKSRKADANLLSFVQQTLVALPVVQAFAAENRNQERFSVLAEDAIQRSKEGALMSSSFGMVNGIITTLGTAIILLFGGARVLAGQMPLGSLLVFLSYMQSMHGGVESLLKLYGGYKPLEASIDRVLAVMSSTEMVQEPEQPVAVDRISGHVDLENITFGYEPGHPVLRDVTLSVQPGERIAFVGHSGAGKSTLVALIARLMDPWQGAILLDGVDLRTMALRDVRGGVSMLLQEPFLFPTTVAANIALGRPEASREQVIQAAKNAGAHNFIEALHDGYDSILGERGATISGGERQRIAIARAFLKNSPILILDEPSSALDAQTEKALLDTLERLTEGRTTFTIAHRLSTVRRATKIVVMEGGRIVETGTHEQLLAKGGVYARYHSAQFAASDSLGVVA